MQTEIYDRKSLKVIIDNFQHIKNNLINRHWNDEEWSPQTLITKYYKQSIKHDESLNKIEVSYKQCKDKIGRQYAVNSLSLQSLPREIRHTIAKDYYYDIDIVNAHPTLLLHYAKTKNINLQSLEHYVKNRDKVLNFFINEYKVTKDEIKTIFISIINGGLIPNKFSNDTFLQNFKKDIITISDYIYNNETKYKKIAEKRKETNLKGTCTNYLLLDIENSILSEMINYIKLNNILKTSCVLIFDGFMIYKDDVSNIDILLKQLEDHIFNTLNIKITLLNKPMNEYIDLSNLKEKEEKKLYIAMNDAEASKLFYSIYKNDVIKSNGILYIRVNGIWETNQDYLINRLFEMDIKKYKLAGKKEDPLFCIEYNGQLYSKVKFEDYSTNYKNCLSIINSLRANVPETYNLEFIMKETTKGKIAFNNGYYDFNKKQFINNFDNVYFTIKINRDYNQNFYAENEKIINDIHKRVLDPVLGNDKKNFLVSMARMIAGYTNDKAFYLVLGERDSGKSKIKNLAENAFQKYVGDINLNCFILNNSTMDENLKLNWLVNNWDKRILFGSEIKTDKKVVLDGSLIKKICSGTDTVTMRPMRENPKNYYIQCSIIGLSNDFPSIEPQDTYEKLRSYTCPHKFVDVITEEDIINNPHYRLKDNTIDDFVNDNLVTEAFCYIILNSFDKLPELTEKQTEFISNIKTEDELSKFYERYEITRNNTNKVFLKDIKQFLISNQINVSLAKMQLILQNRGCQYKKSLYINGKTSTGFTGIKEKPMEEENINDLDI